MLQEFAQEVKNTVTEILQGVHTAIPGKVIAYNPDKCEAEVLPYGKYKKPNGEFLNFPQLNHVPVLFPQSMGQTAAIVYPINPGDECLVLAQEQTLDTWRGSGTESDNDLRFDLTNAVALVGLFSKSNELCKRAQENGSIIVQREDTFIEIGDGKIESLVRHKETAVDSYYLMVDAEKSTAVLNIRNNDNDKETAKISVDGNEGKITLETKNYDTDNSTSNVEIDGQAGTIDVVAKNKATGNETVCLKMDGAEKTMIIQGYVTVKGSLDTVNMPIPD